MNKRGGLGFFAISLIAIFLIAGLIFTNYAYTGQVLENQDNASNDSSIADTQRIMDPDPAEQENATGENNESTTPTQTENTTSTNETGSDSGTGSTSPDTTETETDESSDETTDSRGVASLPGDISSCQEIDYEGIYTLDRDLESSDHCFEIVVNNTVLDCQGYSITGNQTPNRAGIYLVGLENITIKDCYISNFTWGILMTGGTSNSRMRNNTLVNNTFYGAEISHDSHNNQIINNNFDKNSEDGFIITSNADNNSFFNNTFNENQRFGILLTSGSENNNFSNNFFNYNVINGVRTSTMTKNNSFSDCEVYGNSEQGFYIPDSNHTITRSNISENGLGGIYIYGSQNFVENNTIENNNGSGIMLDSDYNLVEDNYLYNNTRGVEIRTGSSDNRILSNVIHKNTLYGVELKEVFYNNVSFNNFTDNSKNFRFIVTGNTFCDNTINNNTGYLGRDILYFNTTESISDKTIAQLILCDSSYSTFDNVTIVGDSDSNDSGIKMIYSQDCNLENIHILNYSTGAYLYNADFNIFNKTTIEGYQKSAFNITKTSIENKIINFSSIDKQASAYDIVINESNRTEVVDTNIRRYDFGSSPIEFIIENTTYGKIHFTGGVNGTGDNLSSEIIIGNNSAFVDSENNTNLNSSADITLYGLRTDFDNPDILRNEFLCPASVCQNLTNLNAGTVQFNVTGWTTYSIDETFTELTACGELNSANTIYKLKNSVNSSGTCFNITANNVTLECRNWDNTIIYGNSSNTDTYYGIISTAEGTVIQNCEMKMGSEATGALERYGIYSEGSNGTITNINASYNRQGIVLEGNASNNNVTNSIANNNEQTGIYIISNNGSRIVNNTANNNKFGIRIYWESDKNAMTNNTANDNSFAGFYLGPDADNNTVYSNNATGNLYGFTLHSGKNNNFYSNNIIENEYGFYINSSNYTNITSNTIEENSICGMKLENNKESSVSENTIRMHDKGLIIFGNSGSDDNVNNNDITNNTNGIVMNGTNSHINSNEIWNNTNGIYSIFNGNGMNNISSNDIRFNDYGIYYSSGSYDNISSNLIIDNDYGIQLNSNAENNTIFDNYFDNSILNANSSSMNYWNTTKISKENKVGNSYVGGNYWPDYQGNDSDGDGLGNQNLPYNLSGQIIGGDYLPITTVNNIPVMQQLFVNSSSGTNSTNENLICYAKANDSEGNALDYFGAWYKDGTFSHNITEWNEAKQDIIYWKVNRLDDGPGSGSDRAFAVAINNEDNIFTGGSANVGAGNSDFWIIKHDSEGNQLWEVFAGGSDYEYIYGLDIDSERNILAVGYTDSYGEGDSDIWVVKYNKYREIIWNKTWGGAKIDRGYGVAVDSNDNIFVVGETRSFGSQDSEIVTIKYDSDGNEIWNDTLGNIGLSNYDKGRDIIVDSSDNIIITGETEAFASSGLDMITIKYNSSGSRIWNTTGTSGYDRGLGVDVDSEDNVVVAGVIDLGSSYGIWTRKFNGLNGNEIWNKTLDESNTDDGESIAVDSNDNIITMGKSLSFGSEHILWIVKYDSDGNEIWNITEGNGVDQILARDMELNSNDEIIVTGAGRIGIGSGQLLLLKSGKGFGYESNEFVSSTLDSSYTASNDNWSCSVKATDNSIPENELTYNTSSNLTILSSPPYFDPDLDNQTVAENSQLYYDINCSDVDEGETLTYYINDSSQFSIYPGTGVIDWTPDYTDSGIYNYNVTCGDGQSNVSQSFLINVTNTNRLPEASNLTLNATSPNNYASDNLTLYIENASDEDGEPVKNITVWKKSNSPITILQMPFEGGSQDGNSTGVLDATHDFAGNANSVNVTNADWNSSAGYDGFGAYEFNGADTLINAGTGTGNAFVIDEFTLFARVYIGNSVNNQVVFSKRGSASSNYDYGLMADAAYNEFRLWISNSTTTYTNANIPNASIAGAYNQWYNVAGTYNGSIAKLYVNGELKDSSTAVTGSLNKSGNDLIIGAYKKGTEHFNGIIDEVEIYDYALSPEQIKALHNNRTDLIVSNETSVGESWTACVTPNDGLDNGVEVCSDPLVIGAVCGNGLVEFGEDCDGTNLNGATCATQGYDSGTLSCTAACTFNTSACVSEGGGNGGNGGGGGGGASYDTTTLSDIEFTLGYEGTYEEDDVIKFTYNNEGHRIKIEDVDDDQVRVTITSTPITLVLVPGIIQRVDLDGNGFDDLLLDLKEITYTGDITLLIKEIPLEAPEPEYPEEEYEPAPSPAPEPEPTPEPEEKGFFEQLMDNTILLIVIASMILILAIGVPTAMHFRKKKKKIKKGKEWYYDGKSKGYTPTTIYKSLVKRGWKHDEIANVMQSDINEVDEKAKQVNKKGKEDKKKEKPNKADKKAEKKSKKKEKKSKK